MENGAGALGGSMPFVLSVWQVEPSRNLLVGADHEVGIEPKMMDVLVFLANHAGDVVTKEEIADEVWADTFVTESVVTRAIAGLRKALGDDARAPRFIETIAKRGYRLIVTPTTVSDPAPRVEAPRGEAPRVGMSSSETGPVERDSRTSGSTPGYSIGQWVCGPRFYGRVRELREILEGHRGLIWLLGTRVIGKTSLLRQAELLAGERYLPLYWDLQGIDTPDELHRDFLAMLDEATDRVDGLEIDADDLFGALRQLRRGLVRQGRSLLLLIDEAEELLQLAAQDGSLLRKLRRALHSADGIRAVLASSSRLWQLADHRDDTSPFLHGLAPPLYLGGLDDAAAIGLARQAQAFGVSRLDRETATEIAQRAGNHPFLVQMLGRETLELDDLERATDAVAADPAVHFFFRVDHDLLEVADRLLLHQLAVRPSRIDELGESNGDGNNRSAVLGRLVTLERLGMIRRTDGGVYEVASVVRARWLRAIGH